MLHEVIFLEIQVKALNRLKGTLYSERHFFHFKFNMNITGLIYTYRIGGSLRKAFTVGFFYIYILKHQ